MSKTPRDEDSSKRIVAVTLDEESIGRSGPDIEHERAIAIYDLVEKNLFAPEGADNGPFTLHIGITGNRLMFDIRREDGAPLPLRCNRYLGHVLVRREECGKHIPEVGQELVVLKPHGLVVDSRDDASIREIGRELLTHVVHSARVAPHVDGAGVRRPRKHEHPWLHQLARHPHACSYDAIEIPLGHTLVLDAVLQTH